MSIIKSITSINFSSISTQKVLTSFDDNANVKLNYANDQTQCGCASLGSSGNNIINVDIDITRRRRCC